LRDRFLIRCIVTCIRDTVKSIVFCASVQTQHTLHREGKGEGAECSVTVTARGSQRKIQLDMNCPSVLPEQAQECGDEGMFT